MVKSRKQSKRMSCRKKYKIERKVREHKRKARKEDKSKGMTKRLKKDPGIPNLYPFKEQLLKQLQEKKQSAADEKARLKLQRLQEKKRQSLQGLQNEALKKTREFEKKQLQSGVGGASGEVGVAPRDPSLKAYYREFKKVVEAADVVLEVLDARDPLGCRCLQVEQAVLDAGTNKKLILLLNKIDLVPKEIVELWLKHLRNEFPAVAFKSSTQSQKHNLSQKKFPLSSGPSALMSSSSACLGADVLLKLLGNYCRNAGIKNCIRVGVVGLPNVGKSSVINSLKRSKACSVGATPGVTRVVQEIQLDKHVKLLDSPGIVVSSSSSGDVASMILRNCIKVESLADPIAPVEAILRRCSRLQVMEHYVIPEFRDTHEFLSHLARRTGRLRKGGVPDVDAAAKSVLRDWNTGKITFYTHPPDQRSLPSHLSADIVREWGAAFDLPSLEEEERQLLSGLPSRTEDMMLVESSQPVTGAFAEGDGEGEEEEEEEEEEGESELEEEMASEGSESELSEEEDMEGEDSPAQEEVTVVLQKSRHSKGDRKVLKLKAQPKRKQQLAGDTDATIADEEYNFEEYF